MNSAVVHVLVPAGLDDPAQPSGGNRYDRRVIDGLRAAGWTVSVHGGDDLAAAVAACPDGALVLVDGLLTVGSPQALVTHAGRLTIVVLAHMVFDDPGQAAALAAAAAVVTTSDWTRRRLLERHGLPPGAVHVVAPGADPAPLAEGTAGGAALLCVAAVTPLKGHDVLVDALARNADRNWHCVCVGSLTRDPAFVAALRGRITAAGLAERIRLAGPRTGAELDAAYAAADVLVLASRTEAYGMVVAEALARGLPVIASAVGGVPETLGGTGDDIPGVLVPPDDPGALAAAVREWLADAALRHRLRRAVRARRAELEPWSATAAGVAQVLAGRAVHGERPGPGVRM